MVPLIARVLVEEAGFVDVPLTPETTCRDVIECVRDPGDEHCSLIHTWGNQQRILDECERPLEIVHKWPPNESVTFRLKYSMQKGGSSQVKNGMKEADIQHEPVGVGGVELTVRELEAMAMRQEEEMAAGRQLLAVKESRLRHLKETEARHAAVAHEQDRLRRLRDRVEAQEQKLNKLRALRGQLDHNKASNHNLTSDLDSIRALFNEKEKELTLAVAKVDELTRQLEDVRRGRQSQPPTTTASQELERLRRELMYRNKVNEQQSQRLSEEREMLCQRQVEMASIDKRIAELQERLHRKRMLNQQLANQISAASNKASVNQNNNRGQLGTLTQQNLYQLSGGGTKQMLRSIPLGNIAAVEPYHHVPTYSTRDQEQADFIKQQQHQQHQESLKNDHLRFSGGCVPSQEDVMGPRKQNMTAPAVHHYIQETKSQREDKQQVILSPDNNNADLTAFGPSKSDPKYQTLPYNTKFTGSSQTGKHQGKRASAEGNEHYSDNVESKNHNNNSSSNNLNHINNNNLNQQQQQHVVHSIPIMAGANKGLAMALSNKMPSASSPTSSTSSYSSVAHLGPRVYSSNVLTSSLMARGQPVGGASSTTSSTSSLATSSSAGSSQLPTSRLALPPTPLISDVQVSPLVSNHQKPVNTVSPSPLQQTANIYQTSSAKIHAVQPQSVTTQPPQVQIKEETETSKPALPPKPAAPVKPTPPPPPRQSHNSVEVTASAELPSGLTVIYSEEPPPLPSEPPPDDPTIPKRGGSELLIKARPLTIKKQLPPSDLPRLKTLSLEDRGKTDDEVGLSERSRMLSSDDSDDTTTTTHSNGGGLLRNRRIEMPPEFLFPENEAPPADLVSSTSSSSPGEDQTDRSVVAEDSDVSDTVAQDTVVVTRRAKKGNLKGSGDKQTLSRRVSFDPLALLLDASLEGELELVMRTAGQVRDPSAANDEGITALHNAICAGHFDIVTFLVKFGCDVNAQDSDGWTPLHCAASCNNVAMVRFLVEHGACIFATTLSDHETAAEKCEEDEEGFDGCSEYLYSVQEKLGIMNNGVVYAVFDYEAHNPDELSFHERDKLIVLRKGDEWEREWWWARHDDKEGYIPRNLLGLYPRVHPNNKNSD